MSSLILRNLTATPLDLVLVERFKPLTAAGGLLQNLTSFCTSSSSSSSTSLAHFANTNLADHAKSFSRHDLSIHIPPFSVVSTDLHPPASWKLDQDPETIRLTFLVAGEKYRLDVPAPKFESQTLQCLAPNPKWRLTGFYVKKPKRSHVAICDSAELNCWMRRMKDETPLSALSIPGTHNSPTCYKALPSVRCQSVSPREQLENGVRFFDVRVQPESESSDRLILVHSIFPISFTGTKYFRDLLNEVYAFLEKSPSETIIMSLKREGAAGTTDAQLARILHDKYTSASDSAKHWYTDSRIPTLGEARGKIVLLRRFKNEAGMAHSSGIDAASWANNTPHDLGESICVQDYYGVLETVSIDKKVTYVTEQMRRAASCVADIPGVTTAAGHAAPPPQPLYLNFLSGSNFWRMGCWPLQISRRLNPAILEYLVVSHAVEQGNDHDWEDGNEKSSVDVGGDGSTGIVVCDWVGGGGDWDLVRCIVAMNCKLMIREMEGDQH